MTAIDEFMSYEDEWFTDQDVGEQVLTVMMNVPIATCERHGPVQVVKSDSGPGFTGAPISWWELSCGCGDVDTSRDTLEAAR